MQNKFATYGAAALCASLSLYGDRTGRGVGCGQSCGSAGPTARCVEDENDGAASACSGARDASGGASRDGSAFVIDASYGLTPISPAIYGVAFAEARSLGVATVQRFGGDCSSMYNWKVGAFNCGADYEYANQPLVGFGYPPYNLPGIPRGTTGTDWLVTFDRNNHVDTLMTVPAIGWVAKDATSRGAASGANPLQDAVQADGAFVEQWAAHLVASFGGAADGGVKYYQLDNEVDNWSKMHPDVHPRPATSHEVLSSIETYGAAIKAADPKAFVLVYSPALVSSLLYSPADFAKIGSDEPFVPPARDLVKNNFTTWLLEELASYEAHSGLKVFDCLDIHYPTAGKNPVEDVRSLWDPSYDEGSWLTHDAYHAPLMILPRIQAWIDAKRPGTGICISEYQYYPPGRSGRAADPASGVAEADALGVFGKYGVKLATYWTTLLADNGDISPTYNAFAMYRNYDGSGGHFGDYSVGATSRDVHLRIYGAVDSPTAPTTLWVMLINKTTTARDALSLSLKGFSSGSAAKAYQSIGIDGPHALPDIAISGGSLTVSLPALSINLLVIPKI